MHEFTSSFKGNSVKSFRIRIVTKKRTRWVKAISQLFGLMCGRYTRMIISIDNNFTTQKGVITHEKRTEFPQTC